MKLLAELKTEIAHLSETNRESALEIATRTRNSAEEATRPGADRTQVTSRRKELKTAVEKFEVSHPGLVDVVNSFCHALADLEI